MTTPDTFQEATDYGSDGFNQYEYEHEAETEQLVDADLPPDEPTEEPIELPPDPIEQREQELQQREQQFQEQQENLQLQSELQGYHNSQLQAHARDLQQKGFYPEQVEELAKHQAQLDLEKAAYQVLHKRVTEKYVALDEGCPREIFKDCWDEQSMRAKAKEYKASSAPDNKKMADLEQRLQRAEAALRRNGVPAQTYNQSGNSTGNANSDAGLIRNYANGQVAWSPQVQRALDRQ